MPTPRTSADRRKRRPAPVDDRPLYQQIAARLTSEIANGTYPVGSRLPTELALCDVLGISRFTARAAIRVLTVAGLVTRRQRVGTVVIALPGDARFSHDVTRIRDLLQYAQDTELTLVYVGKIALPKDLARAFGVAAGDEWVYGVGMRRKGVSAKAKGRQGHETDDLICITRLYLNPILAGIEQHLRNRDGAVYSVIEREFGIEIQRVEQELQGVLLGADDAANLGEAVGAPALRIVRRYYAEDGTLLQVADNIHPSDRFSYRMELRK